jgi:hypothetical protein
MCTAVGQAAHTPEFAVAEPKSIELYYPFTLGVLSDIGPLRAGVLWVGVLAIALILGTRNRLTVAGVAVAVLPTTLQVTVQLTPAGVVLLLLVLLSGTVPFLRACRRHFRATPPGAALEDRVSSTPRVRAGVLEPLGCPSEPSAPSSAPMPAPCRTADGAPVSYRRRRSPRCAPVTGARVGA